MMKPRSLIPLLALTACFGGCSGQDRGQDRIKESSRQGDIVVAALEKYHADNGRYPKNLDELVPKYLQEMPLPTWGLREWFYQLSDSGYILRVNESQATGDGWHKYLRYFGPESGWQIGD